MKDDAMSDDAMSNEEWAVAMECGALGAAFG